MYSIHLPALQECPRHNFLGTDAGVDVHGGRAKLGQEMRGFPDVIPPRPAVGECGECKLPCLSGITLMEESGRSRGWKSNHDYSVTGNHIVVFNGDVCTLGHIICAQHLRGL